MSLKKSDPKYLEKRRALNVKNMREWLKTPVYSYGQQIHLEKFKAIPIEDIVAVMRVFNLSREGFDSVSRFCRRFQQASGEVSADDILEAMRLATDDTTVSGVMES